MQKCTKFVFGLAEWCSRRASRLGVDAYNFTGPEPELPATHFHFNHWIGPREWFPGPRCGSWRPV